MLQKIKVVCILSLVSIMAAACLSKPSIFTGNAPAKGSFFNSMPERDGLVFIGVSGKMSNPKDTLQFALEDAARQIAVFHRVSGEYMTINNVGSGAFDYTHNTYTSLQYDEAGAYQYVDSLQYDADVDTLEIENAFFVRTTYTSALSSPVRFRPKYSGDNKKPDWVDDPPFEIDGYEVGVGFAGRHSSLATTYRNSFNNAVFAIIRSVNTASHSSDLLYQTTTSLFGYKTSNDNTIYSYGTLTGFYVLDTWVDPREKTVWTLAIAKKSQ